MGESKASGIMLTLLLIGVLTLAFDVLSVKAEPRTWIVDDDGLADFHTIQEAINAAYDEDTILVRNGTYYENISIDKTLSIKGENRSNTAIVGNGGAVVDVYFADNVTIAGFTIQNGTFGLDIGAGSPGIQVYENKVTDNDGAGIFIAPYSGYAGNITGNIITNNGGGGIEMTVVDRMVVSRNTIENNGQGVSHTAGISLGIGDNVAIGNTITENLIVGHECGIRLDGARTNQIQGNSMIGNNVGLGAYSRGWGPDFGNTISENDISANNYGVFFLSYADSGLSGDNMIWRNNITGNNACGLYIGGEWDNFPVIGNNIESNTVGLWLEQTSNNAFYHNDFVGNLLQVSATSGDSQVWDDGYPSGGNYWSDYAGVDVKSGPRQNHAGSDGIGDTHYTIDADNTDHYPLMNPWIPFVAATVDVKPDSLSLRSRLAWFTAYIELPAPFSTRGIDVSTIRLNGIVQAEVKPTAIGDYDSDGVPDLTVKFNTAYTMPLLQIGINTLTVTGEVNGRLFEGSDTIRVKA